MRDAKVVRLKPTRGERPVISEKRRRIRPWGGFNSGGLPKKSLTHQLKQALPKMGETRKPPGQKFLERLRGVRGQIEKVT